MSDSDDDSDPGTTGGSPVTTVLPVSTAGGVTTGSTTAPVQISTTGSTTAPAQTATTGSTTAPVQTTTTAGSTPTTAGSIPTPVLTLASTSIHTTARTPFELQTSTSLYTTDIIKHKYNVRGTKESMQWVDTVTKGMESKLSMVKNDAIEVDQLESVYNIAMRVTELKNMAKRNGIFEAFDIYDVNSGGCSESSR
jgi:hypothetical protein